MNKHAPCQAVGSDMTSRTRKYDGQSRHKMAWEWERSIQLSKSVSCGLHFGSALYERPTTYTGLAGWNLLPKYELISFSSASS